MIKGSEKVFIQKLGWTGKINPYFAHTQVAHDLREYRFKQESMSTVIKIKILLPSLFLLSIVLLGFPLIAIVRDEADIDLLIANQEQALAISARSAAEALAARPDLYHQEKVVPPPQTNAEPNPKIVQLTSPMKLDGEIDDWESEIDNMVLFTEDQAQALGTDTITHPLSFHYLAGSRGKYLYALFLVEDDWVIYRNRNTLSVDLSDHIKITVDSDEGQRNYIITGYEPGWVNAFLIPEETNAYPIFENRIHGVWRQSAEGYIVEIRIDADLIGTNVLFTVADVDEQGSAARATLTTHRNIKERAKEELLSESTLNLEMIEDVFFSRFSMHSRARLVDEDHTVLAETGFLSTASAHSLSNVQMPASLPKEIPSDVIDQAFSGQSAVIHYIEEEGPIEVIAAVAPLHFEGSVAAAVIVERTRDVLFTANQGSAKEIFGPFLVTFLLSIMGLFLFSYRIPQQIEDR